MSDSAEPAVNGRRWFANLSVRVKILLAVAVTAVMTLGVVAISLDELDELNKNTKTLSSGNVVRLTQVADLRQALTELWRHGLGMLNVTDPQELPALAEPFEAAIARVDERFAAYRTANLTASQWRTAVDRFASEWADFTTTVDEMDALELSDPRVRTAAANLIPNLERMDSAVEEITRFERSDAVRVSRISDNEFRTGRLTAIIAVLIGLTIAVLFALRVSVGIIRPLRELSGLVGAMAGGDLTRRVAVRSRDEIGRMTVSVNQATDSIERALRTLASSADTLSHNADELSRNSNEITSDATDAASQISVACDAANQVSFNVQTVASGSGEMSSSIDEIARNTNEGAAVAAEAVEAVRSTTEIMSQLGASSAQIGTVIKVISSIAEQTNLLALNATIEAARAGDAGKGFAVVAGEVKDLAQETARSTENIARQIETIQADTQRAVSAIDRISMIIQRINDFQLTIASAVEEQTATTNEMNRNVSLAADASTGIADNISAVAASAERTMRRAGENQRAAAELARLSAELTAVVSTFTLR